MTKKEKVVVIGAGPAGLTAALELLKHNKYEVVILEESKEIGGISRTVNYKGNRIDIGGHRFFSKSDFVMNWWTSIMPVQGFPAIDDILYQEKKNYNPGGPGPDKTDTVMLVRKRISRIYYLRKFFDYPISLKLRTFTNMGFVRTAKAGFSYLSSRLVKRKETSLENFFINRFGRVLYSMFFEKYTEKIWGVHPSKIAPDWGTQRVKGLSISKIILDMVKKTFMKGNEKNQEQTETSLIEQFLYPKYGPGQLWETVAKKIEDMGGKLCIGAKVNKIDIDNGSIASICYEKDGNSYTEQGDIFISSMPIKDLVNSISNATVPRDILETAIGLPYRDFITVGVLVDKLVLKNATKNSNKKLISDCWIYIQEPDVKIGRLQIFNNWSPYMIADFENTVWIGLEYFCNEGDFMWNMSECEFTNFAVDEINKIRIINKQDIIDTVCIKVKKAYPAYFGTYRDFNKVKNYLNQFNNLFCIGRNGQHRYNNMDHSMLTAVEAVKSIVDNSFNKENVWSVNTESEYHESKMA